jgi:gamma-glutamyltranspeptidase / glutathione hydrolase
MAVEPATVGDLHHTPFPGRRSGVAGLGAMVATSQPLAAQAGLRILRDGGNAFDAAVAVSAMLSVVEPTGAGMGGDCFALLYLARDQRVLALNGSGRAPAAASAADLRRRGFAAMPERGGLSVTVPGTVDAWGQLLATHGRRTLADALAPAIRTAERGYPVSELIAAAWQSSTSLLARNPTARGHFLFDGRAPRAGETVRLPALARSLAAVAEGGTGAFYRGQIAAAIAQAVQEDGGVLTEDDLATHHGTWDNPIHTRFRGLTIWECPPNGQGLAALLALGIADGWPGAAPWGTADHLHPLIEAMRLGLADARAWVADPARAPVPVARLLSPDYLGRRRALVRPDRVLALPNAGMVRGADTVYLCVVDDGGNACSFIHSNYMGFGSGLVAGDTGIPLQNRGAGFTLQENHPNEYAPGKRPYHTIIPGLATRPDGSLFSVFGVMGGHMQPQGHLQAIVNVLDYGMEPQRALDAPRFQLLPNGRLALEPWFGVALRTELARRGHDIVPVADTPTAGHFGGGQMIIVRDDGVRIGGSDPRKDGLVAAE